MRFQFISVEKANFSVTDLCTALNVSTSGYYAWCKRETCQRKNEDKQLLKVIRSIFNSNLETYGSPRVHDTLKDLGHKVGDNRVARIMRENGLAVRPRRGWRCVTTKADPINAVADNELDQDFTAKNVNEKWVTDVTFVPTDEGWDSVLSKFYLRAVNSASKIHLATGIIRNQLSLLPVSE